MLAAAYTGLLSERTFRSINLVGLRGECDSDYLDLVSRNWRGRDANDPSVDVAKDADQRF
jgi:hypothetical protein